MILGRHLVKLHLGTWTLRERLRTRSHCLPKPKQPHIALAMQMVTTPKAVFSGNAYQSAPAPELSLTELVVYPSLDD